MKFRHLVKYNGVYYPAGADVPVGEDNPVVTKAKEEVVAEVEQPIVEKQPQYTKTDINRMSTAELKSLAKEQAIDGAEEMTGSELKKVLIEKFGL